MGRPRRVNHKDFHLYDKLHTKRVKMYSGVEMTTLYPIKETKEFYRSIEVWAYCSSMFKSKKKNVTLNVDIPVLENEKTIKFLDKNAWHDWTKKEKKNNEMKEALMMLDKLYPNHDKIYFYELDSILCAFNNGIFISYDNNGNIENPNEHDIKQRKYYNSKYNRSVGRDVLEIKESFEAYKDSINNNNDTLQQQLYDKYAELQEDYAYKNFSLNDVFINIGQNAVCYPVAFSDNTAEWSREKYGKLIGYAHAGEIFFVTTKDAVYFEIKRHF